MKTNHWRHKTWYSQMRHYEQLSPKNTNESHSIIKMMKTNEPKLRINSNRRSELVVVIKPSNEMRVVVFNKIVKVERVNCRNITQNFRTSQWGLTESASYKRVEKSNQWREYRTSHQQELNTNYANESL